MGRRIIPKNGLCLTENQRSMTSNTLSASTTGATH
jgi:hypothetical protein